MDGPGRGAVSVVLHMSVSLDGYMEGPGHDISWHQVDEELHDHINEVLSTAGAFLSGRVNHELMAEFWPTADQDPDSPRAYVEFARIWRDMPKVVYSRTLQQADWNTRVVREVVADEVRALDAETEGDLFLGGARLAAEFFRQDLVDELRLFVNPILLGEGTPLFPAQTVRRRLRLVESRTYGNGVVLLRHARDRTRD